MLVHPALHTDFQSVVVPDVGFILSIKDSFDATSSKFIIEKIKDYFVSFE